MRRYKLRLLAIIVVMGFVIGGSSLVEGQQIQPGGRLIELDLQTGEERIIPPSPPAPSLVFPGLSPEGEAEIVPLVPVESSGKMDMPPEAADDVIPPDDRAKIINTAVNPWRRVVHIEYRSGNAIGSCSGVMLWVSSISTAAHCVYGQTGPFTNFKIRPGRDGDINVGLCGGLKAVYPEEWPDIAASGQTTLEDSRYDWAILRIGCRIGNVTGAPGFRGTSQNALVNLPIGATGYPSLTPDQQEQTFTMWTSPGIVTNSSNVGVIRYTNDHTHGQSGGPLWQTTDVPNGCSNPCVVGSIVGGIGDNSSPNVGAYIDQQRFNELSGYGMFTAEQVFIPLVTFR